MGRHVLQQCALQGRTACRAISTKWRLSLCDVQVMLGGLCIATIDLRLRGAAGGELVAQVGPTRCHPLQDRRSIGFSPHATQSVLSGSSSRTVF